MISLEARGVVFEYDGVRALNGVSFTLKGGEVVGIVGPNGSGKSTLLKICAGILKPKGEVLLNGKRIVGLPRKELAKRVAYLPQETSQELRFSVYEMVKFGRYPYKRILREETKRDAEVVERVIKLLGIERMRERPFNELSGGEKGRVLIARALAQEPQLLLLDEPTAHLDISHRIQVLNILRNLSKNKGILVLSVFHDLNLAFNFSDRIFLLKEGKIFYNGPPSQIEAKTLEKVFEIKLIFKRDYERGTYFLLPAP